MYKEDLLWVWSVWGASIKRTNRYPPPINNIHSQVSESKYQGVVASLWPVATVQGAETLNICIKKTCYEYEVCVGPQSKELTDTHLLYQQHPLSGLREQISGCDGILMTTRNCSRCWNTLYMYEEDLLWVWSVWWTSIITTNRNLPPTPTTSTLVWVWVWVHHHHHYLSHYQRVCISLE